MKGKFYYITDRAFTEGGAIKNPVTFLDHGMGAVYPHFYETDYDVKIIASKAPTKAEIENQRKYIFYNDYRERYGSLDIRTIDEEIEKHPAKRIFLNGFNQEQWEYIAPLIRDTAEQIYLFKCPRIQDLSLLSGFKHLKCLLIFWNNTLENLWDMRENRELQAISFEFVSKIRDVSALRESTVDYVTLDSADNNGNVKEILFDPAIFDEMPHIRHLRLEYRRCHITRAPGE